MAQIRIVIADDHAVVRMGLKALLQQQAGWLVVGEAPTGEEAIAQALLHKPAIVLMDVQMHGMSGVDACRKITEQLPETRVIMLTSFSDDELLYAAVRAGASEYVLKRMGNNDLIRAIQTVSQGHSIGGPGLTEARIKQLKNNAKAASVFSELSILELRILALIAEGTTNREIGGRLFLGEGTVRNYVSSVLSKLNVANRVEAAAFAVRHNAKSYVDGNKVKES